MSPSKSTGFTKPSYIIESHDSILLPYDKGHNDQENTNHNINSQSIKLQTDNSIKCHVNRFISDNDKSLNLHRWIVLYSPIANGAIGSHISEEHLCNVYPKSISLVQSTNIMDSYRQNNGLITVDAEIWRSISGIGFSEYISNYERYILLLSICLTELIHEKEMGLKSWYLLAHDKDASWTEIDSICPLTLIMKEKNTESLLFSEENPPHGKLGMLRGRIISCGIEDVDVFLSAEGTCKKCSASCLHRFFLTRKEATEWILGCKLMSERPSYSLFGFLSGANQKRSSVVGKGGKCSSSSCKGTFEDFVVNWKSRNTHLFSFRLLR